MHIPTINSICGEVVSTTAFVLAQPHLPTYQGAYFRLVDGNSEAEKAAMFTVARGYAGEND
ncbi:BREX-1 system adenine-specific DNA-methyltransferase PglX [Shewanella sp. JNE10-2]|uniref:BREX-1 system adenine-specific DNA-methyltransferase PglX n=1 Tax=unclassified Shewanella TaxID=196818 RepID=UPI002004A3E8|nr:MULTISPECIES: BREX-1 system adenine-specific DNA-methyltransferase PglX [unclassified Shewanella]MCK7628733.1 BREX-1 system adenine-specific DNA-methyltransferase PglX [Shewanella sp. JNE9-1]MCK7643982.1 BREX-1 system adenine-specific DNA-methyltransferase PglX [Shewanella sp. JNE3-1]MCK7652036.1 BREX-1 system adenine-specific DNA-methyltransferase PglX [Shewanella sp. JNE4-1]UPO26062.1 BREX-1 system adenine-specific DNA-methyltransferase PglX [Shewanella sp. JNE10-2]UPO37048.1 BREX-1 syste